MDRLVEGTYQMDKGHEKISEDRIFFIEKQEVIVDDFEAAGYILDIGGGGEGIIGRLKGEQVVAIDPSRRELEGTPDGPLKIIMDATDLLFLDSTFNTATSFFTLMYIDGTDHPKVFGEVFRVLRRGGRFLIWDVVFPRRVDEKRDVAAVHLSVKLPREEIEAGYGYLWPEAKQDLPYYVQLAEDAGFEVTLQRQTDRVLFLELRKP